MACFCFALIGQKIKAKARAMGLKKTKKGFTGGYKLTKAGPTPSEWLCRNDSAVVLTMPKTPELKGQDKDLSEVDVLWLDEQKEGGAWWM
ncbi:hypothetical protein LTR08_007737 [Meristemomyces frigidus]|nr:hypothetical protein LTR08_007737 [Meristemomyces frigidus]